MFDYKAFLTTEFGSLQNVPVLFLRYGLSAPENGAVDKWARRNSVPSAWFPTILALLELERGCPVSLGKYISRGPKCL